MDFILTGKDLQCAIEMVTSAISNKIAQRDRLLKSMYIDYNSKIDLKQDYLDIISVKNEPRDFSNLFGKISYNDYKSEYFEKRTILEIILTYQKLKNIIQDISLLIVLLKLAFIDKAKRIITDLRKLILQKKININYRTEKEDNLLINETGQSFINKLNLSKWTLNNYKQKLII